MITSTFRSSRPDNWIEPRPYTDPSLRYLKHGPILPMEEEPRRFWRIFMRR